eukprot:COSAG02_NODE_2472_length_8743_cov_66.542573_7_plen_76_part_00
MPTVQGYSAPPATAARAAARARPGDRARGVPACLAGLTFLYSCILRFIDSTGKPYSMQLCAEGAFVRCTALCRIT